MARKATHQPAVNFNIISSIGKSIPTKELVARLQGVADFLASLDQSKVNPEDYRNLAKDLANPKLLKNKNTGIQAYTCCAIADVLRLFAPEAPFTPEELSSIFTTFFSQFSHLWDEENPYFAQQCYVLKSIVEVRSVVLMSDLPDAQDLIVKLFDTIYTVSTKGYPPKLEHITSEMLAEIVSEADVIPQKVVSSIIKRLTSYSDSELTGGSSNISNPSFVFSLAVCEANVDKMARQVAHLFSEMLDDSVKATETGDIDYNKTFKALEKVHTSSINIWTHVPDLLGSVMGLISDELNSDNEQIRSLATETIGKMLSTSNRVNTNQSATTFVLLHKSTWLNWLKKSSDQSIHVRVKWVEQLSSIFTAQTTSDITSELSIGFSKCLVDSSEKVRLAALKAVKELPYDVITNKICNKTNLNSLLQLMREKHPDLRWLAIEILADAYNKFMEMTSRDQVADLGNLSSAEAKEVEDIILRSIPNEILKLNYINDKGITVSVDVVLFEKLLPFEEDSQKRVSRLISFYKVLDQKSKAAFAAITKRQKKNVDVLIKLIDLAEEFTYQGGFEKDDKENHPELPKQKDHLLATFDKIISWLANSCPEGINSYECLDTFFKLKNMRLINLVKNCVNSQSDYKTVKNSMKELLLKLSEPKTLRPGSEKITVSVPDMMTNMKVLLYRASSILYNKSNIVELIAISESDNAEQKKVCDELMQNISSTFPGVFRSHVKTLADLISKSKQSDLSNSILKSFYRFVKRFPECNPEDDAFTSSLCKLAISGNPIQAKYAVKIVGCHQRKELIVSEMLESILPLDIENDNLATHLSALAEIYLVDPVSLSNESQSINTILVNEILRKNRIEPSELPKLNKLEKVEPEENESFAQKFYSLRLVVNRVRSVATFQGDNESAIGACEKPVKLLCSIIGNHGEIVRLVPESQHTPSCFRRGLVLAAGLQLLKLAKYPAFTPFMTENVISRASSLLHDEAEFIRSTFLKALQKHLSNHTVSERFLHLVFLMGHEPQLSLKRDAQTWIMSQHKRLKAKRDLAFERILARLIHGLAHDERFQKYMSEQTEDASMQKETKAFMYISAYASMYLDTIADESNVSLLYYFASRVKQYRDNSIDQDLYRHEVIGSEVLNLYRVAEFFQLVLKELADSKKWNLQTWPGKINLPVDLFSPMSNYEEAQQFISRVYIPDDVQIELRSMLKFTPSATKKNGSTVAKATASRGKNTPKQARKPKSVAKSSTPRKRTANEEQNFTPRKSTRNRARVNYGEAKVDSSDGSDEEDADSYDEDDSE